MASRKPTSRGDGKTGGTVLLEGGSRTPDPDYRALFESNPEPVLVFDRETLAFLEVNPAAERLYGWSREEFLHMTAKDIRPPGELPLLLGKLAEQQAGTTGFIGVVRHWTKDHAILEVEVRTTVLEFHGASACLAVIHDVTGSKLGEEMIARERGLLRILVDLLPDCIYLKDLDSRFLLANEAVAGFMGAASSSDLIGRTDADFYPPELAASFRKEEQRVFRSGEPILNKEEERTDASGRALRFLTSKVPLKDERGNTIGLVGIAHDITERKHAESALSEATREWQTTFDGVADAILVFDDRQRIRRCNRAALDLFGKDGGEIVGRFCWDVVHGTSGPIAGCPIHRMNHSGTRESTELELHGRWYQVVVDPLKGPEGDIQGAVHILHDITERKQAEAALRQSELKYRTLYETLHDAFVAVDMEGRIIEFNSAYRKLLGYRTNELRALTYEKITPPGWHGMEQRIVSEQVLIRGYSEVYEKEYRRKNGEVIPVELRTFLIRDTEGRPSQMWAIVRDITGRKRMEARLKQLNSTLERRVAERTAQLREREDRLKAILNTVGDAILSIDRHGMILGINPATERIFGYGEAELLGANAAALVPAGFGMEMAGGITDLLDKGDVRLLGTTREMLGLRKDGTVFPVDLTLSEVDGARIYTCVIRDITRRKELEVEVLRITESERQRVAADLHDGICQELVGIAFMLTAVRSDLPKNDPLSHKIKLIAQAITGSADHTRQVARGMSPVVADGSGLSHALRQLAATTARSHRIRCRFECPVPVTFDGPMIANELYRIAQEAIHNAIRHSEAHQITIRLSEHEGESCLAILDNGRGCAVISHESPGMGLRVMRYRASLIGADLTIRPRRQGGTEVVCRVRKPAAET
jgi:PAS domain S-box-containing protein